VRYLLSHSKFSVFLPFHYGAIYSILIMFIELLGCKCSQLSSYLVISMPLINYILPTTFFLILPTHMMFNLMYFIVCHRSHGFCFFFLLPSFSYFSSSISDCPPFSPFSFFLVYFIFFFLLFLLLPSSYSSSFSSISFPLFIFLL
jgi:hypothetical protein